MEILRWVSDAWSDFVNPPFRVKYFDDDPEPSELAPRMFAIVGTPELRKYAHFLCPCNCGETIVLTSNSKVRPRWKFNVDLWMRPTVEPSVWRTKSCKSHFIYSPRPHLLVPAKRRIGETC